MIDYTDGQRAKLSVDVIRTDRGTQSRKATNPATIKRYAALMREGVEFEALTVFYTPDGEHVLSRGFHRLPAAKKAGRVDVDVIIRLGDLAAARWDSAGSNKHGLRCTPEDYAQAVALALSAKPKASDREIAQHLGIDHKTAAKYRSTGDASPVDARVGRDGRERRLPRRKPLDMGAPEMPRFVEITQKTPPPDSGEPAASVRASDFTIATGPLPPRAARMLEILTTFDPDEMAREATRKVDALFKQWPDEHHAHLAAVLRATVDKRTQITQAIGKKPAAGPEDEAIPAGRVPGSAVGTLIQFDDEAGLPPVTVAPPPPVELEIVGGGELGDDLNRVAKGMRAVARKRPFKRAQIAEFFSAVIREIEK